LERSKLAPKIGAILALLSAVRTGHAQGVPAGPPTPPSASDERLVARDEYGLGKAAFEAGDYLRAGRLFLDAYRHTPHHDALWNAARAYELAGEKARAANLYSQYLAIAPPDARDRDRATAARKDLGASLGRLDIHGHVTDIKVDDVPVEGTSVYVEPGQHLVRGRTAGGYVERVESVQAGAVASVVLEGAPPAPAPPSTPTPAAVPPPVVPAEPSRKPLSPYFFYGSLGLTALAGGLTIASGVDTLETKAAFQNSGSTSLTDYNDGEYKEGRTNVLFWTTAGLAVVTTAVALFLVDWRRGRSAPGVGFAPGSSFLGGSF
jgi:tetratricopeptide (TPR) repeat protein